ncbi:hypothetical protein M3Y99_01543200 [Aphelenchoides fujianensis]|nr:hypothetical protein M3Y99_01543200 [Aphelenchoides fujianensis]
MAPVRRARAPQPELRAPRALPIRRVHAAPVAAAPVEEKKKAEPRPLPHGQQTQCFRVPAAGSWYVFARGQVGRFVFGFRRQNAAHQLVAVDTWNKRHTLLVDETPADKRRPIVNSKLLDVFALSADRLLVYWQRTETNRDLMLSEILVDYKSRSFRLQHMAVASVPADFDNSNRQELINPLQVPGEEVDLLFLRIPTRRNGLLFSLKKRRCIRQVGLDEDRLSEIFRVHLHRDADGLDWLYTWDEASHLTNAQPLDMPKISRVRFDVPLEEGDPASEDFPRTNLKMQKIRCVQEPDINARLFRRVAVHFAGAEAFVLFRAIAVLMRAGQTPAYYRLFHVQLDRNEWQELKFPANFFARFPPHMPQSVEWLSVSEGVIELLFVFNQQIINHEVLRPTHFIGNWAFGRALACRIPFTSPERLSTACFFHLDLSTQPAIPKTFDGRALF